MMNRHFSSAKPTCVVFISIATMPTLFWATLFEVIYFMSPIQAAEKQSATDSSAIAPTASAKPSDSDAQVLDRLLADYRAYGLPFPPHDAEWISIRYGGSVMNGVEQFSHDFLFRETKDHKDVFWVGCEKTVPSWNPGKAEIVREPTSAVLDKIASAIPRLEAGGFGTCPYLALAVQCRARGWNALAKAFLARSRQRDPRFSSRSGPERPQDDRRALAIVAWNYWCNEFRDPKGTERRSFPVSCS